MSIEGDKSPADNVNPATSAATSWTVDNEGNLHFSVVSRGLNPETWYKTLHDFRGFNIDSFTREVMNGAKTAPTNGVVYNVVVCLGDLVDPRIRITDLIIAEENKRSRTRPHWEVACLIREAFTDEQLKQMGLEKIVTMHDHLTDRSGDLCLLVIDRTQGGGWLDICFDEPKETSWPEKIGFALIESGPSSKT